MRQSPVHHPHRSLTMKKSRARRRKARLGRFLQSRAKL
jgi:hypothetical protein